MKIFEFHFNPTAHKDRFFKTFSSEHLFIAGELAHALPQNAQFLSKIAKAAESEYYVKSPHDLKKTIQSINALLKEETQSGNVDWLGNMHAAICAFSRAKGNSRQIFSFAKSGNIQVLLIRRDSFINLGKNIESFKNFVSGTVFPHDKIIVCTKELFDALSLRKLLHDLAFFEEEKQFKELFKTEEKELAKVSGILFSIVIEEPEPQKKRAFPKKIKLIPFPKIQLPKIEFPKFTIPRLKIPAVSSLLKGKIVLVFLFVAVLLAGFGIFKAGQDRIIAAALQKAKTLQSEQKYLEAWQTISPLFDSKKFAPKEVSVLKQDLESKLLSLNFLEKIAKPELLYQIKKEETKLIPNDMVFFADTLYIFNPFSPQIFVFDIANKKGATVTKSKNIKAGTSSSNSAIFYEDPNTLLALSLQGSKEIGLGENQNISVSSMASFEQNIYLFDSKQGQIVKLTDPFNTNAAPAQWLNSAFGAKAAGAKSLSVDGKAWLLKNGNEIQIYYGGKYQQSLRPQIFPLLLHASRLKTAAGFKYLYVLDPAEKRILLFTESGELKKQYQSDAFNNLLDFAVSSDEKIIYILNGSQIFEIRR